ncbi:hypothetical protein E1258_09570 [Micromonospora sp. KC207]|uniref:hypothetical protein n=1 Tax=Micromonospora sp. KC207 TaxID=2530377 RepID=UPI00104C1001|nr:hypothetical protein [Micromonospora sp. KC207]TDC63884.1 hypothetical protein E1258_09570 [Micromonospora sp. KC207]
MTVVRSQSTLYAAAARTATPTAAQFGANGGRGLHLVINVTAVTDTPSVVPTIDGYDAASNTWYNLLTGAAITATGTTVLKIYPGIATVAGAAASDVIPQTVRLVMTHADADSITYSAAAHLVG